MLQARNRREPCCFDLPREGMRGEVLKAGRKREQKEYQAPEKGVLTPSPKANSGSLPFRLALPFFLENYISSQGEQRLSRPPDRTEIAQRNSGSLIGAPRSGQCGAGETGQSGSLRAK